MSLISMCMGRWDIVTILPNLSVIPLAYAFFRKAMSRPTFINSNVDYHDHSREYNIDARGRDLTEILRACEAEDIVPSEEIVPNQPAEKTPLPFFVPAGLTELKTYSEAEFETLYHDAVKSGAPKLAEFIKHYRDLKVLDTKGLNKKATYDVLKAYFGDEMDFGYPNFTAYY